MNNNEVSDISTLLSGKDRQEAQLRAKCSEMSMTVSQQEKHLEEAKAAAQLIRSERDRLEADVMHQVNSLAAQEIIVENLQSTCHKREELRVKEAETSLIEADSDSSDYSCCAYEVKRDILLNDIEQLDADTEELEKWWGQYQNAQFSTDIAKMKRLKMEIQQFEGELKELRERHELLLKNVGIVKQESCEKQTRQENIEEDLASARLEYDQCQELVGQYTLRVAELESAPVSEHVANRLNQIDALITESENKQHKLSMGQNEAVAAATNLSEQERIQERLKNEVSMLQNEEQEAHVLLETLSVQTETGRLALAAATRARDTLLADISGKSKQAITEDARHIDMKKNLVAFDQSNAAICDALERVNNGCELLEAELAELSKDPSQHQDKTSLHLSENASELEIAMIDARSAEKELQELTDLCKKAAAETEEAANAIGRIPQELAQSEEEIARDKIAIAATQKELHHLRNQADVAFTADAGNLDEYTNVENPNHEQIIRTQVNVKSMIASGTNTKEMIIALEMLIDKHKEDIALLQQQVQDHHLQTRLKVKQAEHRRQFAQVKRTRLRVLGEQLTAADEEFRANLHKCSEELDEMERALEEEVKQVVAHLEDAKQAWEQAQALKVQSSQAPAPAPANGSSDVEHQKCITDSRFDFNFDEDGYDYTSGNAHVQPPLPLLPPPLQEDSSGIAKKPKTSRGKKGKKTTGAEHVHASTSAIAAAGDPITFTATESTATATHTHATTTNVAVPRPSGGIISSMGMGKGLSQRSQDDWGWDDEEVSSLQPQPQQSQHAAGALKAIGTPTPTISGVENVPLQPSANTSDGRVKGAPRKKPHKARHQEK